MVSRLSALRRLSPLVTCAGLLVGLTGAKAEDRCQGTLCDLFYDHMAQPQAKQPTTATPPPVPGSSSAPKASTAPAPAPAKQSDSLLGRIFGGTPKPASGGAAAAKPPLVTVQGGGLLGMAHGAPAERCTGTVCDFFYGGPPPEKAALKPSGKAVRPDAEAEDAVTDEESAPSPPRVPRPAPTNCASTPADPWRCYR